MSKQYRPRQPEKSDLYRILRDHLETFLARYDNEEPDPERGYIRSEVKESLESFLECGVLRLGFCPAEVHRMQGREAPGPVLPAPGDQPIVPRQGAADLVGAAHRHVWRR